MPSIIINNKIYCKSNIEKVIRKVLEMKKKSILLVYAFELRLKIKIISLFSLFLLLFMGLIALFSIIYRSHCII